MTERILDSDFDDIGDLNDGAERAARAIVRRNLSAGKSEGTARNEAVAFLTGRSVPREQANKQVDRFIAQVLREQDG